MTTADWDHRPAYAHLIGDATEGQQREGGANASNNCVPTTETIITQAYGGPDIAPQSITDRAYGTQFHGGEDYLATLSVLRQLWPQCPPVSFGAVSGSFGMLDQEGVAGHAIGCSFWCDAAGTIQTHATGIRHVCTLLAHVGGQVHVLNSEYDNLVVLSEADFLAATQATAGELMLFQRPLPISGGDDLTPAQLLNLKRLPIWMERLHHEAWPSDPNAQENDIDVFARQIPDDLNFEGVITALHATFEGNHQPSLEELVQAVKAKVGA